MRRVGLLALFCFFAAWLVPSSAQATVSVASDSSDASPQRKGFKMGIAAAPGLMIVQRAMVPVARVRYVLGGGLTDRLTLASEVGATGYLGLGNKAAAFDLDMVMTGFLGRGVALRGGLGVASRVPSAQGKLWRPGVGGLAGLGYEFRILERGALRLGVDYDVRVRPDGRWSQAVFLALELGAYVGKKRR